MLPKPLLRPGWRQAVVQWSTNSCTCVHLVYRVVQLGPTPFCFSSLFSLFIISKEYELPLPGQDSLGHKHLSNTVKFSSDFLIQGCQINREWLLTWFHLIPRNENVDGSLTKVISCCERILCIIVLADIAKSGGTVVGFANG